VYGQIRKLGLPRWHGGAPLFIRPRRPMLDCRLIRFVFVSRTTSTPGAILE